MSKQIILNAFDMNCVAHIVAGTWRHPESQAARYAQKSASQIFDVGAASVVRQSQLLDRHWRNIRTLASHNPTSYRAQAIGKLYTRLLTAQVVAAGRTVLGVLILTVLSNGLNQIGAADYTQTIIKGLVIIVAAVFIMASQRKLIVK